MSTTTSPPNSNSSSPPSYPIRPIPAPPASLSPPREPLSRMDDTNDSEFYSQPRFVTHIDDAAIERLREYYHWNLWDGAQRVEDSEAEGSKRRKEGNRNGKTKILDLCASWVSHFPTSMVSAATSTARKSRSKTQHQLSNPEEASPEAEPEPEPELEVIGLGMNAAELDANPIFSHRVVQDLNISPQITLPSSSSSSSSTTPQLNATTCVVSIDYLTSPITVLRSLLIHTKPHGTIHLVISNRCFPTKVAGSWLRLGEEGRLELVGRYLWWSGWEGVEVVDLCPAKGEGGGMLGRIFGGGVGDPLWVVRGVKGDGEGRGGGERVGRTEL